MTCWWVALAMENPRTGCRVPHPCLDSVTSFVSRPWIFMIYIVHALLFSFINTDATYRMRPGINIHSVLLAASPANQHCFSLTSNQQATSQPAVFFSHNKSAPATRALSIFATILNLEICICHSRSRTYSAVMWV